MGGISDYVTIKKASSGIKELREVFPSLHSLQIHDSMILAAMFRHLQDQRAHSNVQNIQMSVTCLITRKLLATLRSSCLLRAAHWPNEDEALEAKISTAFGGFDVLKLIQPSSD